jgi:hypothetical protein
MWPYLVIAILVVVPGITCVLSHIFPRVIYWLAWGLIGFGCLNWIILYVGSKTSFPISPYLICFTGILSLFFGMSTFLGFGIWKVTSRQKHP